MCFFCNALKNSVFDKGWKRPNSIYYAIFYAYYDNVSIYMEYRKAVIKYYIIFFYNLLLAYYLKKMLIQSRDWRVVNIKPITSNLRKSIIKF
jgi:hypothetical protein